MKKFDVKKETNNIIEFIRNYYKENNLGGVILGISGGKDSGVVAALFTEALGKENIIGVTMPCHSKEEDRTDAKLISDYFNIDINKIKGKVRIMNSELIKNNKIDKKKCVDIIVEIIIPNAIK